MAEWNMLAGWSGMILGLVSGATLGLYFHRADFAGGYAAYRRRMLRLGHIAFFGLGIINVIFSLSLSGGHLDLAYPELASLSLIAGAFLMPATCFLAAWKEPFRHAFPLPVLCVAVALIIVVRALVVPS